ncbi:DUF6056 family protein [Streptomyces sp. NPDC088775]|uniref:DUF6056 family protein n=1 Tax=Streptomyces sp. NPDC088775 TaxID=3365896 RepID=UPI0037F596DF
MTADESKAPALSHPERRSSTGISKRIASRGTTVWTTVLVLLPLGLLSAAVWIGRLVRPGADDWCFLPVVRDDGASGLIGKFYFQDNGRLANALLVVAYAAFGVPGHKWFALVTGILILGILWAVTASALRSAGMHTARAIPPLVAAMMTVVFLFATQNTYKTFYWPASSVSHTLAPVLAAGSVIPLLLARTRKGRALALGTALMAGVFIGTLSEETAVVLFVVLTLALLTSFWVLPGPGRTLARWWCALAFIGTAIGTVTLYTSPGARTRRERFGADTTSMLSPDALMASLRAFADILGTILSTWQYAGAVAAGLLLGLLAREDGPRTHGLLWRRPLIPVVVGAIAFLISGYLCTVVARPAFGTNLTSASRTWNDYLLLYVMLLVTVGAMLGRVLRARQRLLAPTTVAAAVVYVLACTGLAIPLAHLEGEMEVRAQRWDRQDQWLRAHAAHGDQVLPYTPVSVSGLGEPFGHHGQKPWPAKCVAQWYYLKRITYSPRFP